MDKRTLCEILDALEEGGKIRLSEIARGAVTYLSPYSELEQEALDLFNNGLQDDLRSDIRNRLWKEFDALNGRERSRKRLFINLLSGEKTIVDGDFSGMAETMAQAGISHVEIEGIFRRISS